MSKQRWCIIVCRWRKVARMRQRTCATFVHPIILRCTTKCGEMLVGTVQQNESFEFV